MLYWQANQKRWHLRIVELYISLTDPIQHTTVAADWSVLTDYDLLYQESDVMFSFY